MSSLTPMSCQEIGETAGRVWQALNANGPLSLTRLVKEVGSSRDMVMQAIGWLAREDKIEISESKRGRLISLR